MDNICPNFNLICFNVRRLNNFKHIDVQYLTGLGKKWCSRLARHLLKGYKNEWGVTIVYNHGANHCRGGGQMGRIFI